MHRVLGVIPARLESTRLPRKPLRMICGRPMIHWVYSGARQAPCLDHLLVATDSREIESYCQSQAIPVMMTSDAHRSGTDRVVEVMLREPAEIYVNIQGDEPMITPDHLECLLSPFCAPTGAEVSTLKVSIDAESARDPNNVKVVTDRVGQALYFSRAQIPQDRDGKGQAKCFKHLGIYAYTAAALGKFHGLPPSPLEQTEKLEQLRLLENGIPIVVVETPYDTIGVDTEEDLEKVEAYFRRLQQEPGR
jgi:3-deoxy-manno-octulosonate cytidylyltransferase (CMP-KDO synthetase)